jgi:hypothetical protein
MNRKIWSNEEKATIVLGMIKGEEAVGRPSAPATE